MQRPPRAPSVRFRVDPGDIPAEKVARRLHLTPAQFGAVRARLFMRGFPRPDPDTGMYDLEAIDRWRHLRHPSLFPELVALGAVPTPALPAPARDLGQIAAEAEDRRQAEREFGRVMVERAREGAQRRREAREQLKRSRRDARTEADT